MVPSVLIRVSEIELQEYVTIDEAAFIKCVRMNIDLNVVFVPDVQSTRDYRGSRSPVL
jgi:hypothetical protein